MTGSLYKNTTVISQKKKKNELQKQDYTKQKAQQGNKNAIFTRCKEKQDRLPLSHEKERTEEQQCQDRIKRRKYKLTGQAGKGLGNPLLSELKGNIIFFPNSHTLFPSVSSCDQTDPLWDNKAIVCHGREIGGKRDVKCFEGAIRTKSLLGC